VAPAAADQGLAGAYLAGRSATTDFDYRAAENYYTRAIALDPSNPVFIENTIIALLALGRVDEAVPLGRRLADTGSVGQAANLAVFGDLAEREDYSGLLAELDGGRSLGALVDGLVRAWALVGQGQMSEATVEFDKVATNPGLQSFALYHKALALASAGDFEGADKIMSGEEAGPLRATRRGVVAHVEILSQLERNRDALELIGAVFGEKVDPAVANLRDAVNAGAQLPFDVVRGPRDGLAEVFYTVGSALNEDQPDAYVLGFSRVAEHVRPDHTDATLLSAAILEAQGQFDLANEAYNRIPREDPAYHVAELGRAQVLIRGEKPEAAIEVLTQLSKSYPDLPVVWTTLADTLRREERFAEAVAAYDGGLAVFSNPANAPWGVYFARGISHERLQNWPAAEADFRKALELQPDQPQVLNYLGYSMVEKGINLDEALGMIERAVKGDPESGYIVDSLGWALYRLGRYDEALVHMERAVELESIDPVLNDHLGDVYWAVGRKREAEFQWKRALSFFVEGETPDMDPARVRRKIEVGLDLVLKEEGAAPLAVTENAD
jgi:tetratricopeptide (TPR) repeat protein